MDTNSKETFQSRRELRPRQAITDVKWHSRPSNCLPMNVTHQLLSNAVKITQPKSHSRSLTCYQVLCLTIILIITNAIKVQSQANVFSISPFIVPFQGGTAIYATGEGFTSLSSPKCQVHTMHGILAIDDNTVINDTTIRCVMPLIPQIYRQSIGESDNNANLKIIGGVSGTVEITFFDLDLITVFSITPDWTYISLDSNPELFTVTIHGTGFIETYGITCHSDLFEVKAVFVNATQLMCHLPSHSVTTTINIDVYSVGQPSSIIQETNSLSFTYFATPPEVLSFMFNPSYTSLILEFDREIELGSEIQSNIILNLSCEMVFDSIDIFGNPNAVCHWQNTQQRQIIVQLNSNSTIQPNTSVLLIDNIIRTRYVTYSKQTSGRVTVTENDYPLIPVAIIEGPQLVPYCGNFTLSGRKSYNSGSRPLLYQWSIITMDESTLASGSDDDEIAMDNLVADQLTNQSTISLPSEIFLAQSVYYIALTVRNFLGNEGHSEVFVVKQDKPALNVWILGTSNRLLDPALPFHAEGSTSVPDCLILGSQIELEWVLIKNGKTVIDLGSIITTNKYLLLESHTLERNMSYVLSFSATMEGMTSSASVTIRTTLTQIRASIFGGSAIEYGHDDNILLDAAQSVGLTSDLINDDLFALQWKCLTKPDLIPCINTTNGLKLTLEDKIIISIPPEVLSPSVYIVTVELTYSNELVSSYQQVVGISNDTSGPKVFIEEPQASNRVSVHSAVTINGIVESAWPASINWSSVHKPGYAYLPFTGRNTNTPLNATLVTADLSHLTESTEQNQLFFTSNITTDSVFTNPVTLSIRPGHLLPDNQYCFRLTVTTINGRTRFSEIEIHTATHPSTGDLLISPASGGVSLATVYHFTAVQWTDNSEDFPLNYRIGFKGGNTTIWLTSSMEGDSIATVLPGGDPLIVVLQVSDIHNATTTFMKEIVIKQSSSVDLSYLYDHIRDKAFVYGDLNEALSYLVTALFSIDSKMVTPSHEMSATEFKMLIIGLIADLHDKRSFTPNACLYEVLVWALKSLTQSIAVPSTNIMPLLELIEETVQYEPFPTQTISEDVFTIYSNLLKSSSINDANNSRVLTDEITRSLGRMIVVIGYSVCQGMPLFSHSRHITDQWLGSIKIYNCLLLSAHNLTCETSSHEACPFTEEEQSVVSTNEQLLKSFADFSCKGRYKCSSYCAISSQMLKDIHWSGSPYASIVKSHPIQLHLVLSDGYIEIEDVSLVHPMDYSIPLLFPRSNTGQLKCVHWDDQVDWWSEEGCLLVEDATQTNSSSNRVHCSCTHLNEIAVIDSCLPGYYGLNCDQVCPYGLYGEQCLQECSCSEMGQCLPFSGSCDCSPGWTGEKCDTVCPTGLWGKDCLGHCQCQNKGVCNSVDGECDCPPGWIGAHCNVECPEGFHGDNCSDICLCRSDTECDFVSGSCSCEPGYTGLTCHAPCDNDYYGENCSSLCSCEVNGTVDCDNVNGSCYCKDQWSGDLCDIPPPIPYSPTVASPFPVWVAVTPAALGLVAAIIVIAVLLLMCILLKKHSRKSKSAVFPIVEEGNDGLGASIGESNDGMEEDELQLTRTKSRTVIVPKGKTLNDLFSKNSSVDSFKEPEQIGTRKRWQIIQILPSIEPSIDLQSPSPISEALKPKQKTNTSENVDKMKVESGIEIESFDGDDLLEHEIQESPASSYENQEMVYRKGIYLDENATLKDLRNGFIESSQIDPQNPYFQFLNSDMLGDYILIDNEEDILLSKLEPNLLLPRTIYIETVTSSAVALELCVCGKFAELECTECRAKGYCSENCQQDHWLAHSSTCRIVSARRRQAKKMKKKRKKFEKRMKRSGGSGYTPHPNKCVCGVNAQYECSECGRQGYCSEKCQVEDWELHQLFCTSNQNNDYVIEEDDELVSDVSL